VAQDQDYGVARALLDGPLDRARWEGLCVWVEGGPAARLEERVEYLVGQIDRRPWAERVVCASSRLWTREIQAEDVQPKHRVVRSVWLRDTPGIGRVLKSTHLSGVEQIKLSNPGKRGVMALTRATCAPHLRSLVLLDDEKASLFDRRLGEEGMLPALEHLHLGGRVKPELAEMVNAPLFSGVHHLEVGFGRRTHDLLAGLEAPALRELTLNTTHAGQYVCVKWYDPWPDVTDVLALARVARLERVRLVSHAQSSIPLGTLFEVLEGLDVTKRSTVLDLSGLIVPSEGVLAVVEKHRERLTTGPLASRFREVVV
jgi:hypothetical protein